MTKKEPQQPQGIEQIRDIIFGSTMGDYQQNFKQLTKDIADLEKTLHSRMAKLEKILTELGEGWDSDVERIHQRMAADQKSISTSIQQARNKLLAMLDNLEQKGVNRSDLSQALIELGNSFKPAVKEKGDVTISILEQQP